MTDNHPLTIIIFGGTGDLAQKKLIPALFELYKNKLLPEDFRIIGFSRKDQSHSDYRSFMRASLEAKQIVDEPQVSNFIEHGYYQQGDIKEMDSYKNLAVVLSDTDEKIKACSHKMFYLAVPPNLYEPVFTNLSKSGLTVPCAKHQDENSWTRVLVEKPFGNDSEQAEKLDMLLGSLFNEDQVFRIDHYLAKETIQNIITFRFANSIFEPIWKGSEIEEIHIRLYEESGIRDRGTFYDNLGALRDVGQNHILQMLSLIAMEDPGEMTANAIRKARTSALEKVVLGHRELDKCVVRGQYDGYRHVEGVEHDSTTETYFKIHVEVDTLRWKDVPFYLESGKSLKETKTEIEIVFRERTTCVCPSDDHGSHRNKIIFSIQPNEGIGLQFWAKKPGFKYELQDKTLSFKYNTEEDPLPDAYQRILNDAILGDGTLFTSTEEVKEQWRIITPIIHNWKDIPLIPYKQGVDPEDIKN